jgi:hypothetical protein
MKECRKCKRKYRNKSYEYCPHDGTPLSEGLQIEATLDLNDPLNLDATILINADTSDTKKRTSKKKRGPGKTLIKDPVIAISINEQFPHCKAADDLYVCTRGLWKLDPQRAERAKYAFAINKGEIKEVYEIEQWLPATKLFTEFWIAKLERQGRKVSIDDYLQRYEFIGHLAPEPIRKKYVGKKIPKRHSGNPIMYFNC